MSRATETLSADRLRIRLKARNTPKILGQGAAGGADYRGAFAPGLRFFYGGSAVRALRHSAALEEKPKRIHVSVIVRERCVAGVGFLGC
ncbi:MAG: hypothetical protein CM1200mP41_36800 [Gammaproteobacteria bacterium]|nr:MAG: hypothetical protein CM1200mP41_36800 [Gammaproteobacteria bacterium]